jgi:hypothetical protein
MTENNFFAFITKVSFYLCPDNQFELLVAYFKNKIHKFCDFENDLLYSIQAFIERLDDTVFIETHLKSLVSEMGKDFTNAQKYIVLFRALCVSHYDSEILIKTGRINLWFEYDTATLKSIKTQVDSILKVTEIEKEKSILAFFDLPEELDAYIMTNALSFNEFFVGQNQLLKGLKASDYEHELDKDALVAVKALDGISNLINEPLFDMSITMEIIRMTGSGICVTSENYPEIYQLFLK